MLRDHPPSEPWRREAPSRLRYYPSLRMIGRPMTYPPRHCLPFPISNQSQKFRRKTSAQDLCFGLGINPCGNKHLMAWLVLHAPTNSGDFPYRLYINDYMRRDSVDRRDQIPHLYHISARRAIKKKQIYPYINMVFPSGFYYGDPLENMYDESKTGSEQPSRSDGSSAPSGASGPQGKTRRK